nr:gamma-glutamylcyclotransferase family protein [Pseudooceanicola aestuarii]
MTDPHFFGYGSLVNRATHSYAQAHPARAQGWRRTWRHTAGRDVAILTAVPAPGVQIDGLIAAVPGGDWAVLDEREVDYDRLLAGDSVLHETGLSPAVSIYSIPETKHPAAPAPRPVLLSYLDVVVQGYLREFGEDGARRFFDTTDGWGGIRDDRAAPLYPRAQRLSTAETAFVDGELHRMGLNALP